MTVGYGATHRFSRPARVATVGVGYADGFMRALSNRGGAYIGGRRVPLVGRVSMDLITLDVSELPEVTTQPGTLVDLIGPHNPLDAVGADAGTIGYEILTSLGRRYQRRYVGDDAGA
jgi:alanine racemase